MPKTIDAAELARRLGSPGEPFLLDVREPDEVEDWAIPGAVNLPIGALEHRVGEVPADRPVVTVCASGNRAATAADLLEQAGHEVAVLEGGMQAWANVYDTAQVELGGARVVQVRRLGKGCLSYLIGSGDQAAVVDPSTDVTRYQQLAAEAGWRITHVFDTHLHADHLSGARDLAEATGAVLHLNAADAYRFEFAPLADGETFRLSGGLELAVAALHTPGHTEGSTMFFVGKAAVLSGDTVFVDGVGRPDLAERAEEFARNLHRSLARRVLTLDDDTVVLPGHFGANVRVRPGEPVGAHLGQLRRDLQELSLGEDDFVAWAAARVSPRPPNYEEIIRANMGRPRLSFDELARLEVGPNRCSA